MAMVMSSDGKMLNVRTSKGKVRVSVKDVELRPMDEQEVSYSKCREGKVSEATPIKMSRAKFFDSMAEKISSELKISLSDAKRILGQDDLFKRMVQSAKDKGAVIEYLDEAEVPDSKDGESDTIDDVQAMLVKMLPKTKNLKLDSDKEKELKATLSKAMGLMGESE
jgi:hypothetical protein